MDIRKLFGVNVREVRQARGLSQEELADEAGIHRTYVSQIERGVINASMTTIDKLAISLGVKPSMFFANWQPPKDKPKRSSKD